MTQLQKIRFVAESSNHSMATIMAMVEANGESYLDRLYMIECSKANDQSFELQYQ
ncbi:hypothetical protein LbDm2_1976 [Levilactobacillus brevis]|uniref:hypothetical protein n=1 Tax=Levilactobacillus brevis TaxID=1580 RepID=UPI00058347F0|nr:hypothetical protein [Levilactobacillus brevis]KID43133.1 hypothetical protein LbDm2_1976 [Levilactobacillus brevis]